MANKKYKLTFELYDGTTKSVVFEVPQGEPGPPGYTPVRGVDFWTQMDQDQIVDAVLEQLPDQDALLYTPQELTDAQKAQARTNIGAQEIIVLEDLTSQIVLNHPDLITEQLFSFFKYGRICMFTVQIIVSGTVNDNYGFTVATLPVRCAHRVWINNGTQFYMEKGLNTIRRNGSDLPAGNYMMSGFYISKE